MNVLGDRQATLEPHTSEACMLPSTHRSAQPVGIGADFEQPEIPSSGLLPMLATRTISAVRAPSLRDARQFLVAQVARAEGLISARAKRGR